MKEFIEQLRKLTSLKPGTIAWIASRTNRIEYKNNKIIHNQGEICDHLWFIEKGALGAFEQTPEKVYCHWGMQKNDFATSVNSFFKVLPSTEFVRTLAPTIVHAISRADLYEGLSKYPDLLMLTFNLQTDYYCQTREIEAVLRKKTSEQFYYHLLNNKPELVSILPDKHMATLLGISPTSLNTIKKAIKARTIATGQVPKKSKNSKK